MDNIVLIGMPGSGKSTVGVVLAKNLGYSFLDSDLVIQEREGKKLHEIISEKGLWGFKQVEDTINASIEADHTVIATGGSVVYGQKAMEHLKKIGTVIYLKLPYEEIEHRLGDLNKRGVAMEKDQTLRDLYDERIPLYEKYADVTISCFHKEIRQIIEEIAKIVYEKKEV